MRRSQHGVVHAAIVSLAGLICELTGKWRRWVSFIPILSAGLGLLRSSLRSLQQRCTFNAVPQYFPHGYIEFLQ